MNYVALEHEIFFTRTKVYLIFISFFSFFWVKRLKFSSHRSCVFIGSFANASKLSSSCAVPWEHTHNKIFWSSQDQTFKWAKGNQINELIISNIAVLFQSRMMPSSGSLKLLKFRKSINPYQWAEYIKTYLNSIVFLKPTVENMALFIYSCWLIQKNKTTVEHMIAYMYNELIFVNYVLLCSFAL